MCLRKEISEIKKFNNFHLIEITGHAFSRSRERGITTGTVKKCISQYDTTIIQHHKPYKYHDNKDELFVLYAKFKNKGKNKPLHIVIAKNIEHGVHYKVVTCYVPDERYFYDYGRKLKGCAA